MWGVASLTCLPLITVFGNVLITKATKAQSLLH